MCVRRGVFLCTVDLLPVTGYVFFTTSSKRECACPCDMCYPNCSIPAHTLPIMNKTYQTYFLRCTRVVVVISIVGCSSVVLVCFAIWAEL